MNLGISKIMSGSRQLFFLTFSSIVHLVVVIAIIILARPRPEIIYENVEITSYVTPRSKSGVIASKAEKHKTENVKISAEVSQESEEAKTTESSDSINEQPANDSEITSQAVLLTKAKANRTEAARKADYSGVSQVELTIGSDGLVKKVKLRNSLPYGLDEVALRLVQDSKFKPAMINNKPVASAILFKVRFESEK